MLRLMLLRHAKAGRPGGAGDHERPLAERGREDGARMGRYMAAEGLLPDLAVVSSARRAQETWSHVCPAFARGVALRSDRRIYEAPAGTILEVIGDTGPGVAALLLVGHNPGFHDLALRLAGKGKQADLDRLHQEYPTAGLVVVDFDAGSWRELFDGQGRLERFETPGSIGKATGTG